MNAFPEKKLPEWLLTKEAGRKAHQKVRPGDWSPRRRPFMEKTLGGVLRFAGDALFNETVSRRKGFLQKIDARLKIPVLVGLVIALSFESSPGAMLPYAVFAFLTALISRIPIKVYVKRLLPGLILTLAIAIPAALNFVVKGEPVLHLFSGISITREGLMSASGLVLRVTASLMIVFLITFTTTPSKLIKGLGFYLPSFLRTVISISYRYMFFLIRRLEEFILVGRARVLFGGPLALKKNPERKLSGYRAGMLLLLSLKVKDELSMAMDARGVDYSFKEVPTEKFRMGGNGILLIGLALGIIIL